MKKLDIANNKALEILAIQEKIKNMKEKNKNKLDIFPLPNGYIKTMVEETLLPLHYCIWLEMVSVLRVSIPRKALLEIYKFISYSLYTPNNK